MSAALIAKLESSSEGSRELDAEILLSAGFTSHPDRPPYPRYWVGPKGETCENSNATTSIDAALALAERVLPGWSWGIATDRERGFGCVMTPDEKSEQSFAVWASTPALAICAALLRASAAEGAGE